MVKMATAWMDKVQRHYRQQVMSSNLLNKRLKALEEVAAKGWKIDADNDVVITQASPLEVVHAGYHSHIPDFAKIMVSPEWQAFMTDQARRELGIVGAERQPRVSPFALAVDDYLARRSVSPARSVTARDGAPRAGVLKCKGAANLAQKAMAHPLPAQPTTPSVRVEAERPFVVAQATPLPTNTQTKRVPATTQMPRGYTGFAGFPGLGGQSTKVYCSLTCRIVGGVAGGLVFVHQPPCTKGPQEPIEHVLGAPKMKKSQCKVCGLGDHTDIGDCPKIQQLVARGVEKIVKAQTASAQSPRELHFSSEDE